MSEEAAATAGTSKRYHVTKLLSKDRWKEKLKENISAYKDALANDYAPPREDPPDRKRFELDHDVQDFLKPSTEKARPTSPKIPRIGIDVAAAQKWAGNAPEGGNGLSTPSSVRKKDYPRRALGLKVKFTSEAPEVIPSEGGDESEEASIEITRRREQSGWRRPTARDAQRPTVGGMIGSHAASPAMVGQESVQHDLNAEPEPISARGHMHSFPTDEPEFVPVPIRRTQTTFTSDDSNDNGQHDVRPNIESSGNRRPSADSESVYSQQSNFRPSEEEAGKVGNYRLPTFRSVAGKLPSSISRQSSSARKPLPSTTIKPVESQSGGIHHSLSSPILQEKIHQQEAEEGQALHSAVEQDPFLDDLRDAKRFSSSTTSSYQPDRENPHGHSAAASGCLPDRSPSNSRKASGLHPNVQGFQNSTPLPSPSGAPTPTNQPGIVPIRRQVAPVSPSADSHPHPPSRDAVQQVPRPSPSLNVQIPQRSDYFRAVSGTGGQPTPSAGHFEASANSSAGPVTYTPYTASFSHASSNATPGGALGQLAFDDFADRCSHMSGIFRLQAEYEKPIYDFTPSQWLRAASWWFLRGRAGVEQMVRSRPRTADSRPDDTPGQELLAQPHVDLAKTWWILTDIIPAHPALRPSEATDFGERSFEARNQGERLLGELLESCDILVTNLKGVLASMKRNQIMPPTHALIQGQDQTIWIKYPDLASSLLAVLSGSSARSLSEQGSVRQFDPLAVLAVTDTRLDFSYNRVFVTASMGFVDDQQERLHIPVIVSVMRERNDWHPKVTICAQKDLVSLVIKGDRDRGPSWQDVKWSESQRSLHVFLPNRYCVTVQLPELDFRQLFNLYNHTFRVQSSLLPLQHERIAYETSLANFQYKDSRNPPAFPPEHVKRCRIRLFTRFESIMEGTGERRIFQGFRLLAVTSPKNRILGSASHELGIKYPTLLALKQDKQNPPAITMYVHEENRDCSLHMVFGSDSDFENFVNTINGFVFAPGESQQAGVALKTLMVEQADQSDAFSSSPHNPFGRMHWRDVYVIGSNPSTPTSAISGLAPPHNLRIIAQANEGAMTDRINVGPGELSLRLPTDGSPNIQLYRQAQIDLSFTIDPTKGHAQFVQEVADMQRTMFVLPTIRTFSFHTHDDMHSFQTAITQFQVVFDGLAQSFTIARRRPVTTLSRHRKLEAETTRIQIVAHTRQKICLLLAFFDDLPGCDALSFQLKTVDVFEWHDDKHARGRHGVKLVDAKFSLPGWRDRQAGHYDDPRSAPDSKTEMERRFVCLDAMDPPAENDDIVVGFESASERERFLDALPAPPQAHRGLSIRRRI